MYNRGLNSMQQNSETAVKKVYRGLHSDYNGGLTACGYMTFLDSATHSLNKTRLINMLHEGKMIARNKTIFPDSWSAKIIAEKCNEAYQSPEQWREIDETGHPVVRGLTSEGVWIRLIFSKDESAVLIMYPDGELMFAGFSRVLQKAGCTMVLWYNELPLRYIGLNGMNDQRSLAEYLLYGKKDQPFRYQFLRGRQKALGNLMLFLREFRQYEPGIRDAIRNLPQQEFGTNMCWVHYYDNGFVRIANLWDEEQDEKGGFVTTVQDLIGFLDAWWVLREDLPPYILVACSRYNHVSFTAFNDLSELPNLEYDIINE